MGQRADIAGDTAGQAVNLADGFAIKGQLLTAGDRPTELHHLFRLLEIKRLQDELEAMHDNAAGEDI